MTQDGKIVADYITAGELNGAILKAGTVKTSALDVSAQQEIEQGVFSYSQLKDIGVGLDSDVSLSQVVLVPKTVQLTTTRAGKAMNPLNCYNFTGGTPANNNVLVTISSGLNDYNYQSELEVFGDTTVTFDNPNDRVVYAESEIKQTATDISLVVAGGAIKADSIVNSINVNTSGVQINASKINLTGYVTVSGLSTAGQTIINGSNITTGVINADLIKAGTISGDRIYGGTIIGALLRTSSTTNYLTLQQQYLEIYNAGTKMMSLGYGTSEAGTHSILWMPDGYVYSAGSDFEIGTYNNRQLSLTGSAVSIDGPSGGVNIDAYSSTVSIYGSNLTFNGTSVATQSWVGQQGFALISNTVSKAANYVFLPNGMYFYCTGDTLYLYTSDNVKIFGVNKISLAGIVNGSYAAVQS